MCQLCHVATRFEGQALPVSGKESATVDQPTSDGRKAGDRGYHKRGGVDGLCDGEEEDK